MHTHVRRAALAAAVLALGATTAACGGGDGGGGGEPAAKAGGTFKLGITEPIAIDPYNAQESEGILVTTVLFDGLTEATPDGELRNVLATSRTPNADCTEWTFKIKPDTKFSNGETVDAQAFIRGWSRLAHKAAASDVAYHLAGIEGHDALQKGTATEFSGVTAPDPNTLVVKLSAADCEFDKKTIHPVYSPVPEAAGAATNKTYNDTPIGNGPFKMEGPWRHNSGITLVRNDTYHGDKAKLDRVEISILNPNNAQQLEYQGFQSGQFDWARIPPEQQPAAKQRYEPQGDWIEENTNGMNYLSPVSFNGPMKTKEARLAVSYAIDRKAIIDGVFKGFQTLSTTIVPPVFKDFYQEGLCESCAKPDVARAKQLAQQAGLPPGSTVRLTYNTGAGHDAWVQAVGRQLEQNLGWKIDLKGQPFAEMLQGWLQPTATGLFRFAWGADYPTPENFLFPLLDTKSINPDAENVAQGDNRGRYSNPAFDKLVEDARAEKDEAQRTRMLQQAEKMALDDMAIIPMWNRTQYRLFDSKEFTGGAMDFNEDPTLETISLK
jgi:oligopeptide transport system substrate-binding protein